MSILHSMIQPSIFQNLSHPIPSYSILGYSFHSGYCAEEDHMGASYETQGLTQAYHILYSLNYILCTFPPILSICQTSYSFKDFAKVFASTQEFALDSWIVCSLSLELLFSFIFSSPFLFLLPISLSPYLFYISITWKLINLLCTSCVHSNWTHET